MRYKRISADCHLDLIWLPPDLFVSEAPREMKARMPYVADGPDGRRWVANNGAMFGLAGRVGALARVCRELVKLCSVAVRPVVESLNTLSIEAAVVGIVDRVDLVETNSEELREAARALLGQDNGRPD